MVGEDNGNDNGNSEHVTRGMDLSLLGIKEYMDRSKMKLRARFDESVTHPALSTLLVPTLSTLATMEATSTFANTAWASGFDW